MKKISLLLVFCLMLTICAGCGNAQPDTTTTAPTETSVPVETTEATEETVAPTPPPEPVVLGFNLPVPEGFEATVITDERQVYESPGAPRDISSITVEVLPMDESVLAMTEEEFTALHEIAPPETTEPEETEQTGQTDPTAVTGQTEPPEPTEFKLRELSDAEIDGWPAQYAEYNLVYPDFVCRVMRYEVVVNYQNYVFTFTDATDDNEWLDSYEACVEDLDLVLDIDNVELNFTDLTRYDLGCGMSIHAADNMELHEAEGFDACLGHRKAIILLMADEKVGNLTEMSVREYAQMLCQTNGLDPFEKDIYGNFLTTFTSTDEEGTQYYNMISIEETEDAFWVCQLTCKAEHQASYALEFARWASSLSEN